MTGGVYENYAKTGLITHDKGHNKPEKHLLWDRVMPLPPLTGVPNLSMIKVNLLLRLRRGTTSAVPNGLLFGDSNVANAICGYFKSNGDAINLGANSVISNAGEV